MDKDVEKAKWTIKKLSEAQDARAALDPGDNDEIQSAIVQLIIRLKRALELKK